MAQFAIPTACIGFHSQPPVFDFRNYRSCILLNYRFRTQYPKSAGDLATCFLSNLWRNQNSAVNDRLLPMKSDRSLLEAALVGYQAKLAEIQQTMLNIRGMLGQKPSAAMPSAKPARRKMSAAGRRRIAAAQKKRWAEFKKKAAGEKA